jgi:FkbM family methyltransferase
MRRYALKKMFLRTATMVPMPAVPARMLRRYLEVNAGEGVGDMAVNGEQRFVRTYAGRCNVVFDVGACHGEWTRYVLQANPAAQVHCFEPVAATFDALVASGFPPQVVCNRFGLSDEAGERVVDAASSSLHRVAAERATPSAHPTLPGAATGGAEPGADGATESVQLQTLDAYCAASGVERIDMLKIDVEGHELAVLRGAREMIAAARVPCIQFEYGPFNIDSRVLLCDLFEFLSAYDYDLFLVTPHRLVAVDYRRELENFRYKNFVALHRSLAGTSPAKATPIGNRSEDGVGDGSLPATPPKPGTFSA